MTYRIKIVMGLAMLAVLALLFIRLPVWNFLTGRTESSKQGFIEGQWVGTIDITGPYNPEVFGKTAGPHRKGVMKFTLKEWDSFIPRYAGPGALYIYGEAAPRTIDVALQADPDGSVKAKLNTTPDLGWAYGSHGRMEGNRMIWNTNGIGLAFNGSFVHGTDADYQKLVDANR